MAQPPNYSQIPQNEHRPQPYPSTKVQPDGAGKLSTYHEEDDNKQPPHTLPENQQFTDTESLPAYKEVPAMIHKGDSLPPFTSVEHICVVTDNAPTYDSVPVNVDQPMSSISIDPCLPDNQTVTISTSKGQRRSLDPQDKADYLCFAICACVCCNLLFGLGAICMAIEVCFLFGIL
ncbi:uncharacterized protein LOC134684609 [Mytilus trossulus]|uniref:uncharacterized protein LOC134684609 n=1 Tax=Mytilus trossulus TaxID=6551 RepID=UPI003004DCAB